VPETDDLLLREDAIVGRTIDDVFKIWVGGSD
jgi:hypothetical protein